jgi:hypothetical protein
MDMLLDPIIVAFVGYLTGCLFRTLLDYLFKMLENPDLVFDRKFIVTMLVSLIISLMLSMATFSAISFPTDGMSFIFFYTLGQGFLINHVTNKAVSYLSQPKE